MKINRLNNLKFRYDNLCNFAILLFIMILYAYYEKRIYAELIFTVLLGIYFVKKRKKPTLYSFWNFAFFGICFVSIFYSSIPSNSLQMTRKIFEIGILGSLLIGYLDNIEKINFTYKSFVFAGVALIVRLLISFPINTWGTDRLGNEMLNANSIGLHLAISAIFAFYLANIYKKKLYFVFIIVFFVVIALTGSRKAIVMLLMGISLLYYFNSNKLSKKIKSIFIILLILLLSYYLIMNIPNFYNVLGYRIEKIMNSITGEGSTDISTRLRNSMIDIGTSLFKKKPILGYGIDSYKSISGFGMYSHNNYIEIIVGVGFIGALTYYSAYVYIIKKLYSKKILIYCNPILVIVIMLSLLEIGLVSYYGIIYQLAISLGYALARITNTYKKDVD